MLVSKDVERYNKIKALLDLQHITAEKRAFKKELQVVSRLLPNVPKLCFNAKSRWNFYKDKLSKYLFVPSLKIDFPVNEINEIIRNSGIAVQESMGWK